MRDWDRLIMVPKYPLEQKEESRRKKLLENQGISLV